MKQHRKKLPLALRTAIVFCCAAALIIFVFQMNHRVRREQEKLQAAYTVESTMQRVDSLLGRYRAESDLMKNLISSGYTLSDTEFAVLSQQMQSTQNVIKAHELAKDGTVSLVYPLASNEKALGLDMLTNPMRRREANLAKNSGQYTLAGPFPLVQGGTGMLLFCPIYNADGSFWGFSILVLDWERFVQELELDQLEQAGYRYRIWAYNESTGKAIDLVKSDTAPDDPVQMTCALPNDTWYFEIEPEGGWISAPQAVSGVIWAMLVAALIAAGYWQTAMRAVREAEHTAKMEQLAQQAQAANHAKTRFLYNMSHDIRTPMNAILGYTHLLQAHLDEPERAQEYLGKIETSSNVLLGLINGVLEMSRIENGKITLHEQVGSSTVLIRQLQGIFAPDLAAKNLTLTCTEQVQHEYILCDVTKIKEIFLNLLSNSVKYTPAGGHITLDFTETSCETPGFANFTVTEADDGIGMSAEYLPHLFEEFSREHTTTESQVQGTGLGLPIVKALIDRMGADIAVESTPGKGTRFTLHFTFRIASEEQIRAYRASTAPARELSPASLQGRRILLAEDNDLNAEIASTLLTEQGLQVDRTANGAECLHTLEASAPGTYDFILMDIQMPVMDGLAAARAIRASAHPDAKHIPIIAMTANAYEEDRQKSLDAGMDAHLAKPLDLALLLQTLQQLAR